MDIIAMSRRNTAMESIFQTWSFAQIVMTLNHCSFLPNSAYPMRRNEVIKATTTSKSRK